MKTLITATLLLLAFTAVAQKELFVRVYDTTGKKIYKGNVYGTTDSSLVLRISNNPVNIPVSIIGFIKTKHTAGNNVLVGAISGAIPLAIIGAATAESDDLILGYTAGEGALAGAIIGVAGGAAIGGITILFKHSKLFTINGRAENWPPFRYYLLRVKKQKRPFQP